MWKYLQATNPSQSQSLPKNGKLPNLEFRIQIRGFRVTGLGFRMHLRIFEFVHGGFAPDLRIARPSLVEVATS